MEDQKLNEFLERHKRHVIQVSTTRLAQADKFESLGFNGLALELRRWNLSKPKGSK